jgi:hypothetical protein
MGMALELAKKPTEGSRERRTSYFSQSHPTSPLFLFYKHQTPEKYYIIFLAFSATYI